MKFLMTLFIFISSPFVSAGILLEPQVGYVFSSKFQGTMSYSGPATGTTALDEKTTGIEYGGRLGYSSFGFMGGLNYGKISGTSKDGTDGSKDDVKGSNLGVFVGYNAPVLFRAWLAYNFSSKVDVASSSFEGKSTEVGVGFKALPMISLNFIYRMYDYDKLKSSGMEFTTSNFKPKEMELSVSAPFNLF